MPLAARQPSDEALTLFRRKANALTEAVHSVAAAAVRDGDRGRAVNQLAQALAETLGLADLLGRRRTLLWARSKGAEFAEQPGPDVLPRVPFEQAIEDIAGRMPALAQGATEVQAVYAAHGFTLAQAADLEIVARVQAAIVEALRVGRGAYDAAEIIQSLGDWSRAYAETVYRNNVANAYSAGIDRMMDDRDVRSVILALRYSTAGDVDVRPNHAAMDGTIAPPDHPIWNQRTPPCGHNCRCGRDFMSRADLLREGRLTRFGTVDPYIPHPNVMADPGFGGRPAARIYAR